MKWFLLWCLVGVAIQLADVLHARWKTGGRHFDVVFFTLLKRHPITVPIGLVTGPILWPLGLLLKLSRWLPQEDLKAVCETTQADALIRCPDCGEPYESENACEHPAE